MSNTDRSMPVSEAVLVAEALDHLQRRLPDGWLVEQIDDQGAGDGEGDARFAIRSASQAATGTVLVVAKPRFSPAGVDRLLGGLARRLGDVRGMPPILLVSPFLSPRSRELLAEEDISYLDLTGNVRLVMSHPGLFVETTGAQRQPSKGEERRTAGLKGANAGRIIRFLAEVAPPYRVLDIEAATGVSRGWISRTLDALVDEALIRREPRGPIEQVDWPALLRRRGQSVDLFANATRTYVAPNGAPALLEAVPTSGIAADLYLTGSFAAVRLAPVAAPALLVLYLDPAPRRASFGEVADRFGLLPTDEGANVALLRPDSERPIEDPRTQEGLQMVNIPQLVIDCLSGTGRMPAEGEALIEWMRANEPAWRSPSLDAYLTTRRDT